MAKEYKTKTLKNGEKRYIFDVNLGYRADGTRIRTTVNAKSIKEGRKKVAELTLGQKKVFDGNSMLFSEAYELYLIDCKKKGQSDTTLEAKKNTYRKRYRNFEEIKIKKINETDILKFQEDLSKTLSSGTVRVILSYLNAFFNWCLKKKILQDNPFNYIDKIPKQKKELSFWTEEQFRTFISVVDDDYFKLLFTTLFYTGLRKGEIFGLSYNDVRGTNLYLSNTLKYIPERGFYLSTKFKTDSSKRIVPLPKWLDLGSGSGLIFTKHQGNMGYFIKKYAQLANVPVIRLHDFRHSYVAMLINKGADIYTISKMVGHTEIGMTIGTYGHLYPDKRQQITDIFGDGS